MALQAPPVEFSEGSWVVVFASWPVGETYAFNHLSRPAVPKDDLRSRGVSSTTLDLMYVRTVLNPIGGLAQDLL